MRDYLLPVTRGFYFSFLKRNKGLSAFSMCVHFLLSGTVHKIRKIRYNYTLSSLLPNSRFTCIKER